jgi:hypothetical protein
MLLPEWHFLKLKTAQIIISEFWNSGARKNGAKLRGFSIDYQSLRPTVTMVGRISASW